ncbi:ABC transporter ATP-binding protein [Salinarimonas sp. NSM]|uniref:ABC transporter ATP-binding protein n=1 Tax=Salinarimonas sp. NSM TaxID=3458003 RepID=UPI0040375D2B
MADTQTKPDTTKPEAKTKRPPLLSGDTWPVMRRLWRERMRAHRRTLAVVLGLIAVGAGATALYPLLIREAFDAFDRRDLELIYWAPVVVIVVTSIKGFALFGQTALTQRTVARIEADMQAALYARLLSLDLAQLGSESPASLTQRFTTDFTYIREAMVRIFTVFFRDVATILALVVAMLVIDPWMTLIAALVAPFVAPPIARIGKRLRRVSTATQEEIGDMAGLVTESLAGVRIAKTYRMERWLEGRARGAFERVRDLKIKAATQRARLDPLLEIAGGAAVAAVLLLIGVRIGAGETTIGDFTGFVTALLMAAQPIRALGNLNAIVQEAIAALHRHWALLDEVPRIADAPEAVPLVVGAGEMRFDRVRFRYRADAPALEEIDLTVRGGGVTALVGRSGSGKSTLVALVTRLYDPTEGAVLVDGQDVRGVTLASLRDAISVVSQDAVLFDDTIRANIAFGRPDASEAEIVAAAEAAAAADFIRALPDGWETRVGPAGGRLSGGERQRVALARAFLKDAPILLLDEPTSALDSQSERLVQDALARLMAGRTTLVVAHRLSTVREADEIVVMEAGRIVERGTHAALVARGGAYARLERLQRADAPTAVES